MDITFRKHIRQMSYSPNCFDIVRHWRQRLCPYVLVHKLACLAPRTVAARSIIFTGVYQHFLGHSNVQPKWNIVACWMLPLDNCRMQFVGVLFQLIASKELLSGPCHELLVEKTGWILTMDPMFLYSIPMMSHECWIQGWIISNITLYSSSLSSCVHGISVSSWSDIIPTHSSIKSSKLSMAKHQRRQGLKPKRVTRPKPKTSSDEIINVQKLPAPMFIDMRTFDRLWLIGYDTPDNSWDTIPDTIKVYRYQVCVWV